MYESIFTVLVVIGLLVIAAGIGILMWSVCVAGLFLVAAGELADWLHARKWKGDGQT